MLIFKTRKGLQNYLNSQKSRSIGFVPTMGALHSGHLSLIEKCRNENEIVVCSIFVNPTQFNDISDFEVYPSNLDEDMNKLRDAGCDLLFVPSIQEMYPLGLTEKSDFQSPLFNILEGEFRQGHFQGVVTIVKKLFDIVRPNKAYFGEKDYQQLLVVREMVVHYKMPIEIIGCPIVRESNGLAMSSRNQRLTPIQRRKAAEIYRNLSFVKENLTTVNFQDLLNTAKKNINKVLGLKVQYLDIRKADTLEALESLVNLKKVIVCTAVLVGKIRLIDNIIIELEDVKV